MPCVICDEKHEKNLLYENDKIMILLALQPATSGHLQIFPKQHYSILEEMPEELLMYISVVANKISMLLFELLKVHGTNIMVQNGTASGQNIPHFSLHVIPRRTDDGLKLDWNMKQATPESLENIHRIISENMNAPQQNISSQETPKTSTPEVIKEIKSDEKSVQDPEKRVNYYLKSLERIP